MADSNIRKMLRAHGVGKPPTKAGSEFKRSRQGMRLRGTRPLGGGPGSLGPWSPRVPKSGPSSEARKRFGRA